MIESQILTSIIGGLGLFVTAGVLITAFRFKGV